MCTDYWRHIIFFGVIDKFRKTKKGIIDNAAAFYFVCSEVLKESCEIRTTESIITVIEKGHVRLMHIADGYRAFISFRDSLLKEPPVLLFISTSV